MGKYFFKFRTESILIDFTRAADPASSGKHVLPHRAELRFLPAAEVHREVTRLEKVHPSGRSFSRGTVPGSPAGPAEEGPTGGRTGEAPECKDGDGR